MIDVLVLWDYVASLKNRYFDSLAKLSWQELVRDRNASFNSIRNVFLHIVNVEDSYINYIIAKKGGKYVPYDFEKFPDIDSVRRQMNQVEAKTKRCLSSLSAEEIAGEFEWIKSDGTSMKGRGEDLITHLALEQIHHFGELICLFWQLNIEPPHMGWFLYLHTAQGKELQGRA